MGLREEQEPPALARDVDVALAAELDAAFGEDWRAELKAYQAQRSASAQAFLPSVGRVVHYYGKIMHSTMPDFGDGPTLDMYFIPREGPPGPYAAIVVDVGPGPTTVNLVVFDRDGKQHARGNVPYDDKMGPGSWSWPPRVG